MRSSVAERRTDTQRALPETPCVMAKADLRKAETVDYRARIAALVACVTGHLLLKELQQRIERATGRTIDERQLKRWQSGEERPQFDALIAVEEFRQPILLGFAEIAGAGVEIETVVRVRRIA